MYCLFIIWGILDLLIYRFDALLISVLIYMIAIHIILSIEELLRLSLLLLLSLSL